MAETHVYYQSIANRVRMDMDSRSPRLRLSVVGGLTEAGYTPDQDDEWLETVENIVDFVGAEMENFADMIEGLTPPDKIDDDDDDGALPSYPNTPYL